MNSLLKLNEYRLRYETNRLFKSNHARYQLLNKKTINFFSKIQTFKNAHRLTPLALIEKRLYLMKNNAPTRI